MKKKQILLRDKQMKKNNDIHINKFNKTLS